MRFAVAAAEIDDGDRLRREALDNALRFGATEVYLPGELPEEYILDWKAIGAPDLKRDGHKTDIFGIGFWCDFNNGSGNTGIGRGIDNNSRNRPFFGKNRSEDNERQNEKKYFLFRVLHQAKRENRLFFGKYNT